MGEEISKEIQTLAQILPPQSESELAEHFQKSQWLIEQILELKPYDIKAAGTVDGAFMLAARLHAEKLDPTNLINATETDNALGVILVRAINPTAGEDNHIQGAVFCRNPNSPQDEYDKQFKDFMGLVEGFLNSPIYQRHPQDGQHKLSE